MQYLLFDLNQILLKHLKILGLSEKDTRWKLVAELLELCKKERIDLRNPRKPEPLITEYDYISWSEHKFKKPLKDFNMKASKKVQFTLEQLNPHEETVKL